MSHDGIKAPYGPDNPWYEDETYRCRCASCTGPQTCPCCISCAISSQMADEESYPVLAGIWHNPEDDIYEEMLP